MNHPNDVLNFEHFWASSHWFFSTWMCLKIGILQFCHSKHWIWGNRLWPFFGQSRICLQLWKESTKHEGWLLKHDRTWWYTSKIIPWKFLSISNYNTLYLYLFLSQFCHVVYIYTYTYIPYTTLHSITLHYNITLHYITLHTLHTCMHTYSRLDMLQWRNITLICHHFIAPNLLWLVLDPFHPPSNQTPRLNGGAKMLVLPAPTNLLLTFPMISWLYPIMVHIMSQLRICIYMYKYKN